MSRNFTTGKLLTLVSIALIACLILPSIGPAACAQAVPEPAIDSPPVVDDTVDTDIISFNDALYYTGLGVGSSAVGGIVGTITARAVIEYAQTAAIDRIVAAGYEGTELIAQISIAHKLATMGGFTAGALVGLAIVGIVFVIGYYSYQ